MANSDAVNNVIRSFHVQDTLEPTIWQSGKLNPKVRKILLKVADHFVKSWKLNRDIEIKDIRFTGSLAAFNWSKYSDVDLHIIVDFKDVNNDEELVERFFTLMKSKWNSEHNVKIGSYEIEVYVENENEKHISTGLFSVKNNKWIKEPTKQDATFDEDDVATKTKYFFNVYPILVNQFKKGDHDSVIKNIERIKSKIKHMRQSGLSSGGEFSTENLVFKVLRRTGFLEKINQLFTKTTDKRLSEKKKIKSS